ncbi:S8 family serine peptidase [Pseudaquabacterium pictum]|uniref:Peptidase S8/S53 domain-containing protein n=1 Tax=Pseudaquabacterium pictum TaxID=2315236 RepID=A0A480AM38_9BURK|nr:S8 family serine peptidase [Rubrivivax pictus]GCL62769.1 hypothetical protein AQPW35_18500 [Rubrivivax pictus]
MNLARLTFAALLCAFLGLLPARAVTLVDFEGISDGSALTTQIAGLTFSRTIVLVAGIGINEFDFPPRSGSGVASDDGGALEITFAAPVLSFSGHFTYTVPLLLQAFDARAALVASASSAFASNLGGGVNPPNERIELSFASGFTLLRITGDAGGASFTLDDLAVTAVPEPGTGVLFGAGALWLLAWRRRRVRRPIVAAAALLAAHTVAQAQGVAQPIVSPAVVSVGTPTILLVTARITQPNVIPGSVNVVRVGPGGATTVAGTLNDNGTAGDAVAGDGLHSGQVVLTESVEGNVGLRVSAAVRGQLRRLQSTAALLGVVPAGAPVRLKLPDIAVQAADPATGAPIVGNLVNACFSASTSYASVQAAAAAAGAVPAGRFPAIGNCWQLELASTDGAGIAAAVALLATRPEVTSAEPEPIVQGAQAADPCAGPICADPNYSTVLNLGDAHRRAQALGTGINIGILDTGLDASIIPGLSLPTAVLGSNFSSSGPAGIPRDDNGHGTLVAAIAQATAPGATLFISKVLNSANRGTETAAMLGLHEAVTVGLTPIVNMSLSSRLQTFVARQFISEVQAAGVIIVAAAGNSASTIREYPAAHIGVVAVGNVNERNQRAADSNRGNWVNLAAPGVNIGGFGAAGSGTSFSAPFVAGTLAMMATKYPTLGRQVLIDHLYATTLPIPAVAGLDTCPAQPCNQDLGAGRLDPLASLGSIRIRRNTAVGASGAAVNRIIEIGLRNAAGVEFWSESRGFFGQSTGCEVATVRNPPCIANAAFDVAALAPGTYQLRLTFRDPTASFFGSTQLTVPGARFTRVITGTGSVNAADPTRADFSLFGANVNLRSTFIEFVR